MARIVSFDLDDTLWDLPPVIEKAEEALYQWMEAQVPAVTENNSRDHVREHRMAFAAANPGLKVDMTALRVESLKKLFSEHQVPTDRALEAFDVFYQARSAVTLYEGAVDILEKIAEHYYVVALTNGNADLKIAGIDHLFNDVQQASLTNPPKPDPTMFERTAQVFNVEPSTIIHIGDNAVADVQGGRNAGALSVWFNQSSQLWPTELTPADFEIDSLSALLELLPKT